MAQALQTDNMTAVTAHHIIREMLEMTFTRIGPNYRHSQRYSKFEWATYEPTGQTKDREGYLYIYALSDLHLIRHLYRAGQPLNQHQRLVIEVIVNCDQFWQLPTNLFSFFYGLPNSRGELQALIAS
ncbi:MAG: hypothetical protein ACYDBJ_28330 [Aggregatilineales bacterium]